ncbi:hypothetical protein TsFJ059_005553 [Trichoderma semiorbis]|uniref:Uncharacterized protein n=1 Tax=Trichoderma semiorbis TaxID=1491008 RepID=A0A9P8HU27_9HYPO|nr:hypothetical protein TsFJ059_005553 [Trichoderma semiorbis]
MHNGQPRNEVNSERCELVYLFLRKYFLYWLEALGLLKHIEDGVVSMARLEDLLRVKSLESREEESRWFHPFRWRFENLIRVKSPDRQSLDYQLLELTQDARRFIRQNT